MYPITTNTITTNTITTQQIYDMEEGKKNTHNKAIKAIDSMDSNIKIVINKSVKYGVNFYSPCDKKKIWKKQPAHLCKCGQCFCDIEKKNHYMDCENIYYCFECWSGESNNNKTNDKFIQEWGYDYEKAENY